MSINPTLWSYKRKKLKYYRNIRKNKDSDLKVKKDFNEAMIEYNTIIYPNYLKELGEYEVYRVNMRKQENINNYRIKEVDKYFKEAVAPIKTKNLFPVGKSESDFFLFLLTKSNNFFKDVALKLPVFTKSSYMPDIVYYDNTYNFSTDIEIDEPYEKTNKSAIHYIYKYPFSIDDDRNIFFYG